MRSTPTESVSTRLKLLVCLANTGVKPPSIDNSIPVMKLLSFDARNTAAALAKTIFDVLGIIAVFRGPNRCMKKVRKGQRQNDSADLSRERDPNDC
jgi:hypothetical protein